MKFLAAALVCFALLHRAKGMPIRGEGDDSDIDDLRNPETEVQPFVDVPAQEWQKYLQIERPKFKVLGWALQGIEKIQMPIASQATDLDSNSKANANANAMRADTCPVYGPLGRHHIQDVYGALENVLSKLKPEIPQNENQSDDLTVSGELARADPDESSSQGSVFNFYDAFETSNAGLDDKISLVDFRSVETVYRTAKLIEDYMKEFSQSLLPLPLPDRPDGSKDDNADALANAIFMAQATTTEQSPIVQFQRASYGVWANHLSRAADNIYSAGRIFNDEKNFITITENKIPVNTGNRSWEEIVDFLISWTKCWEEGLGRFIVAFKDIDLPPGLNQETEPTVRIPEGMILPEIPKIPEERIGLKGWLKKGAKSAAGGVKKAIKAPLKPVKNLTKTIFRGRKEKPTELNPDMSQSDTSQIVNPTSTDPLQQPKGSWLRRKLGLGQPKSPESGKAKPSSPADLTRGVSQLAESSEFQRDESPDLDEGRVLKDEEINIDPTFNYMSQVAANRRQEGDTMVRPNVGNTNVYTNYIGNYPAYSGSVSGGAGGLPNEVRDQIIRQNAERRALIEAQQGNLNRDDEETKEDRPLDWD